MVVHATREDQRKRGVSAGRDEVRELDQTFGALADPTRRRVLELLGKAPQRASELAALTQASRPGMSRHLRVLKDAGLIIERGDDDDARAKVFELDPASWSQAKAWLQRVEDFWSEQLHSFKQLAESHAQQTKGRDVRSASRRRE